MPRQRHIIGRDKVGQNLGKQMGIGIGQIMKEENLVPAARRAAPQFKYFTAGAMNRLTGQETHNVGRQVFPKVGWFHPKSSPRDRRIIRLGRMCFYNFLASGGHRLFGQLEATADHSALQLGLEGFLVEPLGHW